jgi:hypothetical protein
MRRRGFYFYFDFPFGIGIRRGPFFRAFWEPWRFPRREEYLRMLEEYKRDLEDYKREIEEELREVERELEELRKEHNGTRCNRRVILKHYGRA